MIRGAWRVQSVREVTSCEYWSRLRMAGFSISGKKLSLPVWMRRGDGEPPSKAALYTYGLPR